MTHWIIRRIRSASKHRIGQILEAAVKRHNELFPEWEVMTVSVRRHADPMEQLEEIIKTLRSIYGSAE